MEKSDIKPRRMPRLLQQQREAKPIVEKQPSKFTQFFMKIFAEQKWRTDMLLEIHKRIQEQRYEKFDQIPKDLPGSEIESRKKVIYDMHPYPSEKLFSEVFLISIFNGVGIGFWLGHRAHTGAGIIGGVIGFSMIYSFFITIVEPNTIDKVALSEEKYSHFLRTEYLKRFTNTSRASLYKKYSEYIEKKYSAI